MVTQANTRESVSGLFNYLDKTARPSLYRNGRVLTKRDPDGSDGERIGVSLEQKEVSVYNARETTSAAKNCQANGFELVSDPLLDNSLDFFDHDVVVRDYYRQCTRLVAEVTGARAYAFDHNIRSASGKKSRTRISGGQEVQGPAHLVHGDYTLYSAPQRLRDLTQPPSINDTFRTALANGESLIESKDAEQALENGRFSIINVWRNIATTPVTTHPLALCDSQSVDPQDLVVFEIHYQDRIGENYFAKYSDAHRWFYYPEMTRAEGLTDKAMGLSRGTGPIGWRIRRCYRIRHSVHIQLS